MKQLLLFCLLPFFGFSQGYTSYFTGNATDVVTIPEFGVCIMGGATEHDNAMKWLLQRANGGDVVVLRSSGSNGYNDYLYSELGITVNSVETLVITSVAGATNPYVLDKVSKAEMIWFAGGDQWNYVSFFKNNALEDVINNHINIKQAPIGGTSAGMAILGGSYFSAQNGTITSSQAMSNPYASNMTIGSNDFLQVPFLDDVITDTHYDNPDRRGRHAVFLARMKNDFGYNLRGIACNEYVAVCIGPEGKAKVFGDYPNYQEFAFFIQSNCLNTGAIETCSANTPLTWNYGGQALKVYKVPGTMQGTHYFDVNVWESAIGSGGTWENWAIVNGSLNVTNGVAPICALNNSNFESDSFEIAPNPFQNYISFETEINGSVAIYDGIGKRVFFSENFSGNRIDTSELESGLYFIKIDSNGLSVTKKIIKD